MDAGPIGRDWNRLLAGPQLTSWRRASWRPALQSPTAPSQRPSASSWFCHGGRHGFRSRELLPLLVLWCGRSRGLFLLQTVDALDDEEQHKGDNDELTTALVNKPILRVATPAALAAASEGTGTLFGLLRTTNSFEKSIWARIRPATGMKTSSTREETTAANAAPLITPIARSTTFPRRAKSRKSLNRETPSGRSTRSASPCVSAAPCEIDSQCAENHAVRAGMQWSDLVSTCGQSLIAG